MAKRYKEKEKKEHKLKIKKVLILIILVVIFIAIMTEVVKINEKDVTEENTTSISITETISKIFTDDEESDEYQEEIPIECDFLNPQELLNAVNEQIDDVNEFVKIQYKLKELDNGTIEIYYKNNEEKLMKLIINIENKIIESVEQYDDENLLSKENITFNLDEDIEKDFYNRKNNLSEGEDGIVNINITNTEVVVNVTY